VILQQAKLTRIPFVAQVAEEQHTVVVIVVVAASSVVAQAFANAFPCKK